MQSKINKKLLIILLLIFFNPSPLLAQNTNVGFVPDNIWYSKEPFEEGDNIKIYTLLFNPEEREFSGTVSFFDNDTLLGKRDFTMKAKSVMDVSVDWVVTSGTHSIYAKIDTPKFLVSPNNYTSVSLETYQSNKSNVTVAKKLPKLVNIAEGIDKKLEDITAPINTVQKTVLDSVPEAISKPLISATNSLEDFRKEKNTWVIEKVENLKEEITLSEKNVTDTKDGEVKENEYKVKTPLKQVELFFMKLLAFVLKSKILFYTLLVALGISILRGIWKMIF